MNVSHTSAICIISLITAASGAAIVQARSFATPNVLTAALTAESKVFKAAKLQVYQPHSLLYAYEPPPNIGGPKRTGGSGGRYI